MRKTCVLPVVVAAFAVAALRAQTIWNVGPGGLPSIPAALAVASPGDIVDISPGVYPAFDCGIGVTLRASGTGTVRINMVTGFFGTDGISMLFAAPAGQTIHVVGIEFLFPPADISVPWTTPVLDLQSAAALENCTLTSTAANARGSVRVGSGARVHLQNVATFGPSLIVDGAATAVQCDLRGPLVYGFTLPAVSVSGSFHASNCQLTGGASSLQAAGAGLRVLAGGSAWLCDCALQRGLAGMGGCAVAGAGSIQLVRCTTNTPACMPAPAAAGLGVQRLAPVVGGATCNIAYRSDPLFPVGVHVSFALDSVPLPFAEQPWGAPLGGSYEVAFGLTDNLGDLTFPFAIPANPAFTGLPLWFHGWSGWSFPLQVAPAVGGLVR
jgi:hypothetical protein